MEEKKFLDTAALSERWGISVSTIKSWRTTNYSHIRGPSFVRIGRRVLYLLTVIQEYEKTHTRVRGV
jgi:hypothetical protein